LNDKQQLRMEMTGFVVSQRSSKIRCLPEQLASSPSADYLIIIGAFTLAIIASAKGNMTQCHNSDPL
jgi:hypothetical protein